MPWGCRKPGKSGGPVIDYIALWFCLTTVVGALLLRSTLPARVEAIVNQYRATWQWSSHRHACHRCKLVSLNNGSVTMLCSQGRELGATAVGVYLPRLTPSPPLP